MIQLKKTADGLEFSDRQQTVRAVAEKIFLDGEVISEPGEYEMGGVSLIYAENSALIGWEHTQMIYTFSANKPTSFEKAQFSSADALIVAPMTAALGKEDLSEILEAYDPRIVVLTGLQAIETKTGDGTSAEAVKVIKFPITNLPEEGRVVFTLE